MPDNVTAPAGGVSFATDEIGGVHFPYAKLAWGANDTAVPVADVSGQRLPVTMHIANGQAVALDAATLAALEQISVTVDKLGRTTRAYDFAAGQRLTLRLPWRHLGLMPGDVVQLSDGRWRVTETRFEDFVLAVELVRLPGAVAPVQPGDGGRGLNHGDLPPGPTILEAMDLPPLPGALPDRPLLWIAGAGTGPGWRRAPVNISLDGGASFAPVGLLPAPVPMGVALAALPPANTAGWDRLGSVEIDLIGEAMWLESRSDDAVLEGANLALLGDELIQFGTAVAMGSGRFRLSRLLRGRRGTEWAVDSHAAGERFVLIDPASMLAVPLPLERLGATLLLQPRGSGDSATPAMPVHVGSAALRPLAAVHVRHVRTGGELRLSWVPQSRAGFGWPDLTDVPLGELTPAWRATLRDAVGPILSADLVAPAWTVADRPGPLWLDVAQLGLTLGQTATHTIP